MFKTSALSLCLKRVEQNRYIFMGRSRSMSYGSGVKSFLPKRGALCRRAMLVPRLWLSWQSRIAISCCFFVISSRMLRSCSSQGCRLYCLSRLVSWSPVIVRTANGSIARTGGMDTNHSTSVQMRIRACSGPDF